MNQVTLIGRVGKDAEFKSFDNGGSIANFSLATKERGYKLQNGTEVPEHTDWHTIVVRNKLAEIASDYIKKGMQLAVMGKIYYREYEHQGVKRIATEIHASNFEMLGSPEKKPEQTAQPQQAVYANQVQDNTGDLPF